MKIQDNASGIGCFVDLFPSSSVEFDAAPREQCWCYFLGIEYFFGADYFFGAESKVSDYLQYSQKDSRVTSPDFLEPIQL